jgi:WhiB family redox-sensing transcriptional regulator
MTATAGDRASRTAWRARARRTAQAARAEGQALEPVDDLDLVGWGGDPAELVAALDADRAELLAAIIAAPPAWHADAACRGLPREWFFPGLGQSTRRAVAVCNTCPVRTECLDEALADPELDHGIRAGLAPRTRAAMRQTLARGAS